MAKKQHPVKITDDDAIAKLQAFFCSISDVREQCLAALQEATFDGNAVPVQTLLAHLDHGGGLKP